MANGTKVKKAKVKKAKVKKAKATNGAKRTGPSKRDSVFELMSRKTGATVAQIVERLSVTEKAAMSLIFDVKRATGKTPRRERTDSGSVYFI